MNLIADANAIEAYSAAMKALPMKIANAAGNIIWQEAQKRSHGAFSTAELKEMYDPHGPYSKADPHPPQEPGIINIQSGAFASEWVQEITATATRITVSTYNVSDHAKYLEPGTSRMIARPLNQMVTQHSISAFAGFALPSL